MLSRWIGSFQQQRSSVQLVDPDSLTLINIGMNIDKRISLSLLRELGQTYFIAEQIDLFSNPTSHGLVAT